MTALHWKAELLHRAGPDLLPGRMPIEVLIHVARNMAMYKDGALDRFEMAGVWDFLRFWVDKLLNAQHEDRRQALQDNPEVLLVQLVEELDVWVRLELVSRLVGYPLYSITISELFRTQIADGNRKAKGRGPREKR